MIHEKNFGWAVAYTLVTLTHPYPLVTFRLSLSFLAFDYGQGPRTVSFPEVT